MNTNLREALVERIDAVGPAHLDLDTLVALGETRLRRRRRRGTAAVVGGVAAAVAVVVALAGARNSDTSPTPIGPSPTRVSPRPPTLVPQMSPGRINEFVLQYPDPTAADRAMVHAVEQMKHCPRPPGVKSFLQDNVHDPIGRHPGADGGDAQWVDERLTDVVRGTNAGTAYAFFVARADNVLIVIENNSLDDAGTGWRSDVITTALPRFRAGHVVHGGEVIASDPFVPIEHFHVDDQSVWPPRMTRCVADPSTWGAENIQGATFVGNWNG